MLFYSPGEDEDVIQVDYYNPFYNEVLEDVVHYCLEGGWAVGHSKEYYQGFEQSMVGMKSSLPLASGFNLYVVETPMDIQLSKILGSTVRTQTEMSQNYFQSELTRELDRVPI